MAPIFTIAEDTATLYEEGLQEAGGAPNDGIPETGDPITTFHQGDFGISDADGDPLTVTLAMPTAPLTSNGETIAWSGNGTNTLTGSANGHAIVTINIDDAGAYDVTLNGPIDHSDPNSEDNLSFDVNVTASDGTSSTDGVLTINIGDDSPIAESTTHSLIVQQSDTNLMIMLDVSGSMNNDSGVNDASGNDLSRLDLAKQSIHNLLDGYAEYGAVSVHLVTFAAGATQVGSQWMDIDDAKSAIDGLSASGGTNYDAALGTAIETYGAGGIADAQNVSYFMSDGQPTVGSEEDGTAPWDQLTGTANYNNSDDTGIQLDEETLWTNFLTTNLTGKEITSIALGMGTGVTTTNLAPIAYGTDPDGEVITNLANLDATLQSTIIVPPIEGTILENSGMDSNAAFGADGGHLQALTIGNVDYTFDASNGSLTASQEGAYSYDQATHEITITTPFGAQLTVNFDDSTYSYLASLEMTNPYNEGLTYTIFDSDGDKASASLLLSVSRADFSGPTAMDEVQMSRPTLESGLLSEYYAYDQGTDGANLELVSQVKEFVSTHSPDATYLAESVFYSLGDGDLAGDSTPADNLTNLEEFLGTDATSLNVTDPALGSDAILHMEGYVELSAGNYNFQVHSDDGFAIYIDGTAVAIVDNIQRPTTSEHAEFSITSTGDHHIEIFYWDQGGAYVFKPELRQAGGDYQQLSEFDLKHVSHNAVSGSVMDNIDFGTNGAGQIDSIEYNDTTYLASDFGDSVTLATQTGGQLTFNFTTGEYTFDNSAGYATPEESFTIIALDGMDKAVSFDLRLSSPGTYSTTQTDDFNSGNDGWQTGWIGSTTLLPASTSGDDLSVARDHYVEKTFTGLQPGEVASISFDAHSVQTGGNATWEAADEMHVYVNGVQTDSATRSGSFNEEITLTAQADTDGNLTVKIEADSSYDGENLLIDNVTITSPGGQAVVDNTLYGDNARAEQFVIDSHDDVAILDFDQYNDVLDIHDSGVTTGTDDLIEGGTGSDALLGGAGDDVLHGNNGGDLLIGGSGDDQLQGDLGADTFAWHLGDQGTTASPAIDTAADFSTSEGDTLDLSDLLQGESSGSLEQYLHFEQQGTDTVVHISHNGDLANSGADQLIVLEGMDFSSHADDASIIQTLLNNGNLITD